MNTPDEMEKSNLKQGRVFVIKTLLCLAIAANSIILLFLIICVIGRLRPVATVGGFPYKVRLKSLVVILDASSIVSRITGTSIDARAAAASVVTFIYQIVIIGLLSNGFYCTLSTDRQFNITANEAMSIDVVPNIIQFINSGTNGILSLRQIPSLELFVNNSSAIDDCHEFAFVNFIDLFFAIYNVCMIILAWFLFSSLKSNNAYRLKMYTKILPWKTAMSLLFLIIFDSFNNVSPASIHKFIIMKIIDLGMTMVNITIINCFISDISEETGRTKFVFERNILIIHDGPRPLNTDNIMELKKLKVLEESDQ